MYQIVKKSFFVYLLILSGIATDSYAVQKIGVPYVQNYPKSTYLAGNQNWSVTRDKRGVMYFGNADGLLSFDGKYWQTYTMPHHVIVRSVAAADDGKIYVGGFGEIGYWSYNPKGHFVYTSLSASMPAKDRIADEPWKIYFDGSRVIFQSFSSIFIYEKGRFHTIHTHRSFLFLFKVEDRFFVEILGDGLYELKGKKLARIPGSEILGTSGVLSILPHKNGYLIGAAKSGLFLFDGHTITPWQNEGNEFLKTYQLNNGVHILGRYYAYGTITNGIIILDDAGREVRRINKLSGLQNNTVLSMYADAEQNLWAGLDNGIDRIEVNSPLYFYYDKKGQFGTVYSSLIYAGKLYLGTNQGLFYSNWPAQNSAGYVADFKLVKGTLGQVWDLSLIDGQLLCGHNIGTFRIGADAVAEKLSDLSGGWIIRRWNNRPDMLLQGTYTGLIVYRKNASGKWVFSHKVAGFNEPSRFVEQENRGQVWISHPYKGLYKLVLDDTAGTVISKKYYDSKSGLPDSYQINVFSLQGKAVFATDSGFYSYDEINDRFNRYDVLNRKLGSFSGSNKIIPAGTKRYWFIDHGRVALSNFSSPGKIQIDSNLFSVLNGRMVQYYENISRIDADSYLISVDDGFVIFTGQNTIQKTNYPGNHVLIRRIENITGKTSLLTETGKHIEIPFAQNNLRITYALPYYKQGRISYQFYLDGYSSQWSDWSAQTQNEFTNLSQGTYHFRVRARINNSVITPVTDFTIEISPPWYATIWAYIFYIFLLIFIIIYFRKVYLRKLKAHQDEIERKLEIEKEEELKREYDANEQQIARLRNKQLQNELESKSRELANSAMNIVYKNELLQNIRDTLHSIKDKDGRKLAEEQLRKINQVINDGMTDERDWNLFEKSFNETHENFFKKLKSGHPELNPNDLKLCAYLRMNMSSKEMASLLNISVRGVEIRRYRLRKKLNLPQEKNLAEFLIEL